MRQFQESIRPDEGIPAGLQSNWKLWQQAWERQQQAQKHLEVTATNLGAPATCQGAPRITVEQSGKNNIFFGNAAGAPGNHSYYLSFNDLYNSCIQFVFSSIYLCIYITTHLHTVYLDWLQAVLESNSRCAWKGQSSELSDSLRGHDRASLEMQLVTEIEWCQRFTGRPCPSELGDAVGGPGLVNSEMHFVAMIEGLWRYTGRPWSSEFGDILWDRDRVRLEMQLETEIDWS